MHVLILGAAGMVGRKLVERIARDGRVAGEPVDRLTLVDIAEPPVPAPIAGRTTAQVMDFSAEGSAARLIGERPDVIFHLASIISGDAEAHFEKGYRINLAGTHALFEAIRVAGESYRPRVVFSSSSGVFGAPFPEAIGDTFFCTPLTSYGTQKAMLELLLADYTRRGFFDGIGVRFPGLCVRPGEPNSSAGGFFSNIIRYPLLGQRAILPAPDDAALWFASPRSAVGFLLHAAELDLQRLGGRPNLMMPGVSASVADIIEALRDVAGEDAVRRIERRPDETIMRIVAGWPRQFDTRRAHELGFTAETDFRQIIENYITDELPRERGQAQAATS